MLVLSRKTGDRVLLRFDGGAPAKVEITVHRVQVSHVKMAFDAPPSVLILRGELADSGTASRKYGAGRVEDAGR